MGARRLALTQGGCAVMGNMVTGQVSTVVVATALDQFRKIRADSMALAGGLSDADASVQSMPDASPTKWHLAHTTWFLETFVLRDFVPDYRVYDPEWGYLFNSYYEGAGERHSRDRRGMLTRPSLGQVLAYRAHVDAAVIAAFDTMPPRAHALIALGGEHEAQHQELMLTDIVNLFAQNPLAPAYRSFVRPAPTMAADPIQWIEGRTGPVAIGHDGPGFAFDCETPRHTQWLAPHVLADRLVTNGEWQDFIDDGGYAQPEYWLADGWAWVERERVAHPLYWRGTDSFGLDGLNVRAATAAVAHISHYEADAFARWAGARLPTEAEWESAAPDARLNDMFGTVWQWTASAFLPFPGFRVAAGAVGEYNGKFMSGQMVLRGSSAATPPHGERATVRNFFPPTARWQFSGLRLARDI